MITSCVTRNAIMKGQTMPKSHLSGKRVPESLLVNIEELIESYYRLKPDLNVSAEKIEFGTSGHRGSSKRKSFNKHHILAITQAICLYRREHSIDGPLFLGIDTHALSIPAMESAMEVLAANGVDVMVAHDDGYTPTPVISHAIRTYNHAHHVHLADGIVITPSHNPPDEGGFKYNPPHGGPADSDVTSWIEKKANELLKHNLEAVLHLPFARAMEAATTHRHDYMQPYISDLANVIDMAAIRASNICIGADPLGGASVHYWKMIAECHGLNLVVTNDVVDKTFSFMTLDWDGKVRMDPSSKDAMASLISLKDKFDIAFACDTDADRHGIITKSGGLLPPNHFLCVAVDYLFTHRPKWNNNATVAKTIVSSEMIDRVTTMHGRNLYSVPVGFKWFVNGLSDGSIAFAGEESAGATFVRFDGSAWTTDKDGIIMCLLAAEITAKMGKDPAMLYHELTEKFGNSFYGRVDAAATTKEKTLLKNLSPADVHASVMAGDAITSTRTHALGNNAPIGGIKVSTANGWFAARPSGTEDIYKIYAESFVSEKHLQEIFMEAQDIVDAVLHPVHGTHM